MSESRHIQENITLTRTAYGPSKDFGGFVEQPRVSLVGRFAYGYFAYIPGNNPFEYLGPSYPGQEGAYGGGLQFGVSLEVAPFDGAPGAVSGVIEYDLPLCSGFEIEIRGQFPRRNPDRPDGFVDVGGTRGFVEGWYHWVYYVPPVELQLGHFGSNAAFYPAQGSIYRIPLTIAGGAAAGATVEATCGEWAGGVFQQTFSGSNYRSGTLELDGHDVTAGTFAIVATNGLLEARANLLMPPVAILEVTATGDEDSPSFHLDGSQSFALGLNRDDSALQWSWGVPFTSTPLTTRPEADWDASPFKERVESNLDAYTQYNNDFTAIINPIDDVYKATIGLYLAREDLIFYGTARRFNGADSQDVNIALFGGQVAMLHNRAGEMFTAITQQGAVKVYRFSNGTSSRVELWSLAGAKNPTLWWRGLGSRSFEMRLMVQEGALWRVRSSHNDGKGFEMPITVWSAPYVSATGATLRNGDEVSVARDGLNVYFRRSKGDDWSAPPVLVGALATNSNKALQVRVRIESNSNTIEITNAFDRTWRSEADGVAGSWVAV